MIPGALPAHLVLAPGRGLRCDHPSCKAKADNYARCVRCRAVIARCYYCESAWAQRDRHCAP